MYTSVIYVDNAIVMFSSYNLFCTHIIQNKQSINKHLHTKLSLRRINTLLSLLDSKPSKTTLCTTLFTLNLASHKQLKV
jgi:hypothetical protein